MNDKLKELEDRQRAMADEHDDTSIGAGIKYGIYKKIDGAQYVAIYKLYVDEQIRRKGIARILLSATIDEIKARYPNLPILIIAEPYEKIGMSKQQLVEFYSDFDIEIVEEWPGQDTDEYTTLED